MLGREGTLHTLHMPGGVMPCGTSALPSESAKLDVPREAMGFNSTVRTARPYVWAIECGGYLVAAHLLLAEV